MPSTSDDAKPRLLAAAEELAASRGGEAGPGPAQIRRLLALYYAHADPDDLATRSPEETLAAALSHLSLAGLRPQGTADLRVFTPTVDVDCWTAGGHSVVEIVTDDMPFLVDSVTMALTAMDRAIHLVIHPQLPVRRDLTGRLLEIVSDDEPPADPASAADVLRESWMHIEIDRVADRAGLDAIEARLSSVLRDVREVVEDWERMRHRASEIVADIAGSDLPLPPTEVSEARALLEWLGADHFTFLGYREYTLSRVDGDDVLRAVPGTGLGILRSDQDMAASFGRLPSAVGARARDKQLLIITKANSRATVHRPAYLDYVGVKTFDAIGEVVGERRFLGLFSSAAYTESLLQIPVLRHKAAQVLERSGYGPLSHSGKAMLDILETYPRDELFQTSVDELLPVAEAVLHLRERRRLRLFVRRDTYGRYLSCLVYLPRDRYTTVVRERMQQILRQTIGADSLDYTARVSESVLARLHFVLRAAPGRTLLDFDEAALEQRLSAATRSWTDDLAVAIADEFDEQTSEQLARSYRDAFPEAYKEDFPAEVGAADVRRLEELGDAPVSLLLYEPADAGDDEVRFKIYRKTTALSLSEVLPVLTAMGVEVVDERPYQVDRTDGVAWVYDFGLRTSTTSIPAGAKELFQDAFMAVWAGRAESDGFSALVLGASLPWRQVSILRAYAKYFRQGGSTFSQEYIESALLANVPITRLLVQLFEARFDPGGAGSVTEQIGAGRARVDDLDRQIRAALDAVASLDQDRILRSYLSAIQATLRTNFYQLDADGQPKAYLALKLEPTLLPDLPEPRPKFEIFVYAPRVEGVHLRFGAVARGGLRWSDRREDFRTEVLGLVKAQMVKNAVIVPVGAKGGFYCKQLPDPADREAWLAEGIACYRTFVSGLLDVTDNLVDGTTVPPSRVVRYDGDDSYLVVAADKGTATFSDIANDIAHSYGFWLGDAFASGGSVGYDHKAMGITARGAWESVRRHFRERGIDCQTTDFTAVGIGDMSGDVFGNAMLLSEHIRLIAAFDHRHIFLDPEPPPEAYAERRRLFELPRSSWADYDATLLSSGGGVFSRALKSVPISAQVAAALGLGDAVASLTPAELLRAILLAPVDLLWNGGIGTYVKAAGESHADVGDKANDAIRVDGGDLRAKAVGEGGNLGLTQRGRIEYAQAGGRINTDFIDNSAGVDTSDHEVNIKILLDRLVAAGSMTGEQRNALLASMTDEVAALVLADNDGQNLALANSSAVALPLLHVHESWIGRLERRGLLKRAIEYLPSDKELRERRAAGKALTTPELSVLLAYTKIVLAAELLEGDLADDPFLRGELFGYFPATMRQDYREAMQAHPLRREIVITQIVNSMVNFAGITFFHRLSQETGATAEELARAHLVARELYGADHLVSRIAALDNDVDAAVQTDMRLSVRTLIERASRWLVNNRRAPLDSEATVAHFGTSIEQVVRALPETLVGSQAAMFASRRDELQGCGVPLDVAADVAVLPFAYAVLEIVEASRRDGADPVEFARLHATVSERLGLSRFAARIAALPRDDRWQTMARASLRDDFHALQAVLTAQVLAATDPAATAEDRVRAWGVADEAAIDRTLTTLGDIMADEAPDLARLSVGLRVIRGLLSTP